jgi:cell division septal protein FtsQ
MAKSQSDSRTRAEKIRARRQQSQEQSPTKPFGTQVTRKQTKQNVPITRRPISPQPKITRNRRTVNVQLKNKGSEVQLPALPRVKFGWRLFSGALALLAFAVVFSFISLDAFEISSVNLEGAQRLSSEAILNQTDLLGKGIISLKPDEIEDQVVEKFTSLKTAKVSVGLPAKVTIEVTERQPVLLWQLENSPLWIDAEGVTFPVVGELQVQAVVIANGNPPEAPLEQPEEEVSEEVNEENLNESSLAIFETPTYPRTTPEFVQVVLSLLNYLPEGSNLQFDPAFGLGWQDPQGWMVYFGQDINNIDIKLAEYETIVGKLQEENITPTMISLEFLHAPFYRME